MTPETETKAGAETETTAAEPRARLSPEQQRALIERRRRRAASPATEAIPPRPRDGGPIPLSLAQGRLWFLERLHPGSPVYNLPVAIRLEGRLDTAALERALGELVRRHEALRTVFAEVDGRPVQVVQEAGGFSLPTARVRPTKAGKETEDQDASVRLLAQKEARRPFDLAAGPLVRGVLLRLAPRHHVLLLTMHHLVFDGWSRGIFFRELDALYAAFAEDGSATPVPEPPRQYGDFAVWQRGHLDGPALDGQIAWWRGRLAGAVALPLLTDRPHPAGWTDRGARLPVSLPGPLVDALAALGRSEGATLFMTLLAAYQALLARYTGEPDVVVGAPISGRTRPETEGIVGFFANTLVLRTDLDGDPTFRELLRRVRETALGAFAHQGVPFERLVAEVNAERTINRTPLTPVMIALQDALPAPLSGPRLRSSFLDVDPGTAMFDLFLNLQQGRDAGGEVRGAIEYATDLFDAATIARFAGHLRTLLEGAVADPDCRVSALPLLAEPERRRLLGAHDAAAGEAPPDDNATIHGRFEAWAARTPEAPALLSGGHHLTYRDLDRRANRLAHRLRALGVGPGVAVGLCLARSPGLVVGLLAILKAGGIAVPLDPAYPPERLAFMLDDSRAPVLVGDEPSVARLATGPVRAVLLDRDRAEIEREPDGAPVVDLAADAPAYVVYTSGSTGTPKGVVGLHRGAVNLARWLGSTYPFAAGETGCHVTSFSFVDAVWDLFGPLLNGAPTRLVDEEDRKDPRRLIEVLAEAGAARVIVVASMLRAILETGVDLQTALPDLRFWFSSAELLPPELAARFYRQAPHATLINTYGSSEVTAVVTWHEVARSVDRLPRVPIGRPIANARVLVLDGRGEPVPVGVPGELCVGGAPVARGYLRRPELTAERFVPDPDPVAARSDARLFRTGDRGRVLANGDLEFLGRIDRQVKIRGFRVEPGEIEAALGGHPAVREVAVVAGEDGAGGARLVAYVVPQAGQPPTADELRVALRQRLPDYMAPSVFVPLDALPRTATGKVDRRALPAPELGRPGLSAPFAAPRTPVEAALAASWEAVLGVDPVGVRDNFFDLGGHSLLVAQAMNRLRDAFGLELPLRTLFEAPTVAELAERVEEAARRGDAAGAAALAAAPSLVALQPEGAGRPVFLIPGGAGEAFNLFRFAKLARRVGLDRPFYGFYATADDGEADPQGWVEATAAGYLAEVRAVQPDGPYLLAGACAGAMIAWEMASQLVADGGEVARLLVLDAWVPGARRGVDLQELERRDQRASGRGGGRRGNGGGPGPAATATAAPSLPGGKRNRKGEVNPFKVEAGAVSDRRQRLQQYRPRRYPGRVVLFVNEEWHAEHPTLGWDAVAGGGLEVVVLPGGHGTYLTDHMGAAVERLREFLDGV